MPEPTRGSGYKLSMNIAPGLNQVLETFPSPAVMEERHRLAREIHDTLVQEFAGILLHLEAAARSYEANWRISPDGLACAKDLAKSGLEDARRMLLDLRPTSLEGTTIGDALRRLAERLSHDSGIACSFRSNGRVINIPEQIQDELYRVAQEALCNMRKHARATSASILLSCWRGVLILKVKDNGRGMSAIKSRSGGNGYGLSSMRERAQRIGGRIEINTAPGIGTEVVVTVPLAGQTSN